MCLVDARRGVYKVKIIFLSFNKTNSLDSMTYGCVHNIHIQVGLNEERAENNLSDLSGNEVNRQKKKQLRVARRARA